MATAYKIRLSVDDTGIVKNKPQTAETAARVSEILQENHEYHIFFDTHRRHDHIVHHLLTLYGLGASTAAIEKHYKDNVSYQRPIGDVDENIVKEMADPECFKKYLGEDRQYCNFLEYWRREIDSKGWENVVNENLFARTERADNMLTRLFAGLLHPFIHLGFGMEFHQPAIIAEALAQTSVHEDWPADLLLGAEKAAKQSSKTIPEVLEDLRADSKLYDSVKFEQGNKLREGMLPNALNELIHHVSQWTVGEDELETKTAEMFNSVIYMTAAAQNPPKQIVLDFGLIHAVNSDIFTSVYNGQSWLSTPNKCRLLEWKARMDLAFYAAQGSPKLLLEEIFTYTPNKLEAGDAEWKGIYERLFNFPEDGHAIKFARAVTNAQQVCKDYEDEDWARIKSFMWEKIGNMDVDSTEDTNGLWGRSVGFPEAWEHYKDKPRKVHL